MSRFSKIQGRQSDQSNAVPKIRKPEGVVARKKKVENESDYSDDPYTTFLEKAETAFFTGDLKHALQFYSKCLQLDSTQITPWVGQLNALVGLRQYKEALLWSERAMDQFPEEASIINEKARVVALNGSIKQALASSDFALSKGSSATAWWVRGEILLEARDNNTSFCFEKAMEEAGPEDWKTPYLIGTAYIRKRMWSNAQKYLRIAVERKDSNFYFWQRLGVVYLEQSYLDQARDAFEKAIALNPECRESRILLEKTERRPFLRRLMGVFRR